MPIGGSQSDPRYSITGLSQSILAMQLTCIQPDDSNQPRRRPSLIGRRGEERL